MVIEGFTSVTLAKDRNIIVVIQVPAEMCDGYSEAMSAKKIGQIIIQSAV